MPDRNRQMFSLVSINIWRVYLGKVFIVAEIGVNHNGDLELAKRLIDAAALAGADAVKTQLFAADKMTSASARKAGYQLKTADDKESQLDMLKKLELSADGYRTLCSHAKSAGVAFFAAPFDMESAETLARLGSAIYKVASGEITNLPLLLFLARQNARIFVSTGMSELGEIRDAVAALKGGASELTLLHCHTQYPTEFADANLMAIPALREEFGLPVGYSDHTPGIEAAIAAVALGAAVIEKHFTLDRALPGPDHQASLEPGEFAHMARAIRNIGAALGDGHKKPTESERKNIAVARKSIVAARPIRQGEIVGEDMITAKRPGDGVSPMRWFDVVGRPAARAYAPDEMIEL